MKTFLLNTSKTLPWYLCLTHMHKINCHTWLHFHILMMKTFKQHSPLIQVKIILPQMLDLPRSFPCWNCSSRSELILAFFLRSSYFFWVFFDLFLFRISSSSGLCIRMGKQRSLDVAKNYCTKTTCFECSFNEQLQLTGLSQSLYYHHFHSVAELDKLSSWKDTSNLLSLLIKITDKRLLLWLFMNK